MIFKLVIGHSSRFAAQIAEFPEVYVEHKNRASGHFPSTATVESLND